MCGILGFASKNQKTLSGDFTGMLDALSRRGPDSFGVWSNSQVTLGHRRLAIIDLSPGGYQPMLNEDESLAITFNGEIYNYRELKQNLGSSHVFKGASDTEVLLHRYEEVGDKLASEIEGMFAFALYDQKNSQIFLARDHFGKKPLYYYLDEEVFVFGSEIKAFLQSPYLKSKLTIDEQALSKFLYYGYIPAPHSIFSQIKKLDAASCATFDLASWQLSPVQSYWKLEEVAVQTPPSEEEVLAKITALLESSVEKRLMSDVPLGIFLSGGVDSSVLAKLLTQKTSQVNAFSVCYHDYPEADESSYVNLVTKTLGIKSELCYLEASQVEAGFLEILDYLDEPFADAAVVPLAYLAKQAKPHITVALSGDGGDEVFGGYPKYAAQLFLEKYKLLAPIFSWSKKFLAPTHPYYKVLDQAAAPFYQRQFVFGSGSILSRDYLELVAKTQFSEEKVFEDARRYAQLFTSSDPLNRSLYLDCKIQLPDGYLVKGDRATMRHSLEMRNPLLDKSLAEYLFSLPGSLKVAEGTPKYLLKKLAARYYPPEFVYRKKSGFGVPLNRWIQKELKEVFAQYIPSTHGYFNEAWVAQKHHEHLEGIADHRFLLFRILVFNYWYQKYYAKA